MLKKHTRRSVLGGFASVLGTASLASPALSLSQDFLNSRGDLRFGLLADYPPYVFMRAEVPYAGILTSIGRIMANELWLSPSYAIVRPQQYMGVSIEEIFSLYGGLDVLLNVPHDTAKEESEFYTIDYIEDNISYIALPDSREMGLYPSMFRSRKALAFPNQIITRYILEDKDIDDLDIAFDVSVSDLVNNIPLERILNNEFEMFLSSRRQLEWMNADSPHKFYINDLFLRGKSTQNKYCAVINPKSQWMFPQLNARLEQLSNSYALQLLYNKYNLIFTN